METEPRPDRVTKPGSFFSQPGFLLPGVQALAIQLVTLALLFVLLLAADALFGWQVSIGVAALLQGAVAAALSYWRRLPVWWLPIQFCFPVALLLVYALDLSPSIFLGAFVLLLLVYWTPFRTRVPLFLSGESVWENVAALLPQNSSVRFIDIGSGLGGLVLYLSKQFPHSTCTGVELAPLPWFISWLRGGFTRSSARFVRGDYNNLDFSQFDVVFAFLSPAAMSALWEKAHSEMPDGSLLLSYEFIVPGIKPDIVIDGNSGDSMLYGWRISNISHK